MDKPYELHSWSRLYREEALQEASRRHLVERLRVNPEHHSGWGRVRLTWATVLSFLSGV